MEQKKSKSHLLIMLGICTYFITASCLLVYGLINRSSRPYVIGFIVIFLLFSAYAVLTAKSEPAAENAKKIEE